MAGASYMNMRLCTVALLGLLPAMAAVNDIDINKTAGNPSAPVTVEVSTGVCEVNVNRPCGKGSEVNDPTPL